VTYYGKKRKIRMHKIHQRCADSRTTVTRTDICLITALDTALDAWGTPEPEPDAGDEGKVFPPETALARAGVDPNPPGILLAAVGTDVVPNPAVGVLLGPRVVGKVVVPKPVPCPDPTGVVLGLGKLTEERPGVLLGKDVSVKLEPPLSTVIVPTAGPLQTSPSGQHPCCPSQYSFPRQQPSP